MAFTDSFTYSNGNLTANGSWLTPTGGTSSAVDTGRSIGITNAAFSECYYNQTFATAHYAKAAVTIGSQTSQSTGTGVAVRMQTGAVSLYYLVVNGDTSMFAGELVAGTPTDWEEITGEFTSGQTIELAVDQTVSTTFYVKVNGSTIRTYTSKSALSGGKAGVVSYGDGRSGEGPFADTWEGGDVGTAQSQAPKLMMLGVG